MKQITSVNYPLLRKVTQETVLGVRSMRCEARSESLPRPPPPPPPSYHLRSWAAAGAGAYTRDTPATRLTLGPGIKPQRKGSHGPSPQSSRRPTVKEIVAPQSQAKVVCLWSQTGLAHARVTTAPPMTGEQCLTSLSILLSPL
eukprot:gene8933-biopygen8857